MEARRLRAFLVMTVELPPTVSLGGAFRIPRCFAAVQDVATFSLLLEDLGVDCRPGDQVAGCGIADAYAVVAELTTMHVGYWRSD